MSTRNKYFHAEILKIIFTIYYQILHLSGLQEDELSISLHLHIFCNDHLLLLHDFMHQGTIVQR